MMISGDIVEQTQQELQVKFNISIEQNELQLEKSCEVGGIKKSEIITYNIRNSKVRCKTLRYCLHFHLVSSVLGEDSYCSLLEQNIFCCGYFPQVIYNISQPSLKGYEICPCYLQIYRSSYSKSVSHCRGNAHRYQELQFGGNSFDDSPFLKRRRENQPQLFLYYFEYKMFPWGFLTEPASENYGSSTQQSTTSVT